MSDVSVSRNFLSLCTFSTPLTIAVVLSLLCDVMTAPTETDTCRFEDHKYYFNDICCDMCAPGHKVESHCTQSNSTSSCLQCPTGYFQSHWSGDTRCTLIDKCDKRFEHVSKLASLDRTTNNECACDVGYKYSSTQEICIEAPDEQQMPHPVSTGHPTREQISQHVSPPVVIKEFTTAAESHASTYPSTEITTPTVLPFQPADKDQIDKIQKHIDRLVIAVIIGICCVIIVVAFFIVYWYIRHKGLCCPCFEKFRTKAANTANSTGDAVPGNNGAVEERIQMIPEEPESAENNQALETTAASTNTATSGGDTLPGTNDGREEIPLMIAEQPESVGNNPITETEVDADDEGCATRSTVSRAESTESGESHPERSSSESGICREDSTEDQDQNSPSSDDGAAPCHTMTERHRATLRKLMTDFVNDLPVPRVLDRMPFHVFTNEDVAKITNRIYDEYEQRRQLIYILMTKGPDAFDKFVRVLDEVCPHLASALKSQN